MPESVVLLHGFSGTRRAWDGVIARLNTERYRPLALDLPGHGEQAGFESPITFASCVEHVLSLSPERFTLCGYSLGGRIALHVALAAPERCSRLVLVSSTAGIEEIVERERRAAADRRLADEMEDGVLGDFIERWRSQPLFAGDPPGVASLAREDQRRNGTASLAAALRGLGTGEMEPLWGRLGELAMPLLAIAGERDEKFRALGRRLVAGAPEGELVLAASGHVVTLEDPGTIARALEGVDSQAGSRG